MLVLALQLVLVLLIVRSDCARGGDCPPAGACARDCDDASDRALACA